MALVHGCSDIGEDIVSQCGGMVTYIRQEMEFSDDDEICEYSDDDNSDNDTDDNDGSWPYEQVSALKGKMALKAPPCDSYLEKLLDPVCSGVPGRDVFRTRSVSATRESTCHGHYDGCGEFANSETSKFGDEISLNHLVFDFDKRSLLITDWNHGLPCCDAPQGLDDPVKLWSELECQIRGQGQDSEAFRRYSAGLQEVLQDASHGFHHAGGCGCGKSKRTKEVRTCEFDGHDHATRVLIAVGPAPEHAFGRTFHPGDVLAWTIYHGFTAL